MDIVKLTDNSRYSENLDSLLKKLGAKKVLDLKFESGYQGDVDISVLLKDGRVFSYYYSYGSCSGCDDWEARSLSDEQIEAEMKREATYFRSIDTYNKYKNRKRKSKSW